MVSKRIFPMKTTDTGIEPIAADTERKTKPHMRAHYGNCSTMDDCRCGEIDDDLAREASEGIELTD